MRRFKHRLVFLILLLVGCAGGESAQDAKKPSEKEEQLSYAEAVVIYNAELETLERLQKKRRDMIARYETENRPDAGEVLQPFADLLDSAGEAGKEGGKKRPIDPNQALDEAVRNAEKAREVAGKLFESLSEGQNKSKQGEDGSPGKYSEEFQKELTKIDKEIEEQEARVERARRDRDAAEKRRN